MSDNQQQTETTEPEVLDLDQRARAKAVEIAARAMTGRGGSPFGAVRPESSTDVIDVADYIVSSTHPALRDHLIYGETTTEADDGLLPDVSDEERIALGLAARNALREKIGEIIGRGRLLDEIIATVEAVVEGRS